MAKKVEQGEKTMKSLAAIVGTERIRLVKEAVSLFEQLDLDIPKSEVEAFTKEELKEQIERATLLLEDPELLKQVEEVRQARQIGPEDDSKLWVHPNGMIYTDGSM